VTIAEEVDLLRTYLEIEHERFGEKLRYTIDVDPDAGNVRIPRFLLQPLVENAVKHGIGQRDEGGSVAVTIRKEGDRIVASVSDDGPPFPTDLMGGHGLQSVSQSLDLVYSDDYSLRFFKEDDKRVEIEIPARQS
jgi:two-component system, LytTR family, sensor kinase